ALAGQNNDVQILNMKADRKVRRFTGHGSRLTSASLSADGQFALTGDEDGEILYWDLATHEVAQRLSAHDGAVLSLTFLPNGIYALSGGADGSVRLWDLSFGKECRLTEADWQEDITAVSCAHD